MLVVTILVVIVWTAVCLGVSILVARQKSKIHLIAIPLFIVMMMALFGYFRLVYPEKFTSRETAKEIVP